MPRSEAPSGPTGQSLRGAASGPPTPPRCQREALPRSATRPSTRQGPPLVHRHGKRPRHLFRGLIDRLLTASCDRGSPRSVPRLHARKLFLGARKTPFESLASPGLRRLPERLADCVPDELCPRHGVREVLSFGKPMRLHHPNGPTLFVTREGHQLSNLGRFTGRSSRPAPSMIKPPVFEVCHTLNGRIGDEEAVG